VSSACKPLCRRCELAPAWAGERIWRSCGASPAVRPHDDLSLVLACGKPGRRH